MVTGVCPRNMHFPAINWNLAGQCPGGLTQTLQPNVSRCVQSSFQSVVISTGLAVWPAGGGKSKTRTACSRQWGQNLIGSLVPMSIPLTALEVVWWCLSTGFWFETSGAVGSTVSHDERV